MHWGGNRRGGHGSVCGGCRNVGEQFILAAWPGGRPKPTLSLRFCSILGSIQRHLSTTDQLERMSKEVKRRTIVVEVFYSCVVSGAE